MRSDPVDPRRRRPDAVTPQKGWRHLRRRATQAIRERQWELGHTITRSRTPSLPPWTGPATALPPILVGGTGRSGTTIVARILGAHPGYLTIPFEVKVLSSAGGIGDVVAGRCSVPSLERQIARRWYDRGPGVGLQALVDRPTLRALLLELHRGSKQDPRAAAERFVHRLLDPIAIRQGAQGWIEMTPSTIKASPTLATLLPDARFVHVVRDGRDVACSVVPRRWGPADIDTALGWWAASLDKACTAAARIPPERVLTVRMESLLVTDRDREYDRLRAFARLDDDPAMRAFFDGRATAERAHVGRWRTDVPLGQREAFDARYRTLAAGLATRWGYEVSEITVPAIVPVLDADPGVEA